MKPSTGSPTRLPANHSATTQKPKARRGRPSNDPDAPDPPDHGVILYWVAVHLIGGEIIAPWVKEERARLGRRFITNQLTRYLEKDEHLRYAIHRCADEMGLETGHIYRVLREWEARMRELRGIHDILVDASGISRPQFPELRPFFNVLYSGLKDFPTYVIWLQGQDIQPPPKRKAGRPKCNDSRYWTLMKQIGTEVLVHGANRPVAVIAIARLLVLAGYAIKNGELVKLSSPLTDAKAEKEIDRIRKMLSRA